MSESMNEESVKEGRWEEERKKDCTQKMISKTLTISPLFSPTVQGHFMIRDLILIYDRKEYGTRWKTGLGAIQLVLNSQLCHLAAI